MRGSGLANPRAVLEVVAHAATGAHAGARRSRPEILARLPTERAPWGNVVHMYEIGRAPENPRHPDHALAQELARGFWASLPYLDRDLIAAMLARAGASRRGGGAGAEFAGMIDTEAFRAALGRIACGYDGGQIVDD
jgi:hypothetical protein